MLRLGAHESIAGGLHHAFERGAAVGCDALQIWTKNSRQWAAPPLEPDLVRAFCRARHKYAIRPVVAHAAYLINIGSPDPDLHRRSIAALRVEVERCEQLRIPYLVLHPGAHTGGGLEFGTLQAAKALSAVHTALQGYRTRILLETTAGQGTALGGNFENLAHIMAETVEHERLGVCLDTCHVFAAGYDLTTRRGYAAALTAFDDHLGLEKLQVLHLNDSRHPLGSHRDRHEHIGQGYLGLAAFAFLLNDPRLAGRPGILETPKSDDLHEDQENLAQLRALVHS